MFRRFALTTSPWSRAPLLLFRYPGLLLAVSGAVVILSMASAAGPLFVSSAGNAALHRGIEDACPWAVGVQINAGGPLSGQAYFGGPAIDGFRKSDRAVRQVMADIPHLAPMELLATSNPFDVSGTSPDTSDQIRLVSRTGFLDHVQKIEDAGGAGVWLPHTTAGRLGVHAGDQVTFSSGEVTAPSRVAGIYRDLATLPRSEFWCAQDSLIYPLSAFAVAPPPPLILMDIETLFDLGRRLKERGARFRWEFQIQDEGLTLPQAEQVSGELGGVLSEINRSREWGFSSFPRGTSGLPFIVSLATETSASLRGPVETISIAGRVVALFVIAAAGLYWVRRRRVEVGLLTARGVGPWGVGGKVLLEAFLPAALAAGIGWLLAGWLVRAFGPIDLLSSQAPGAAARQIAFAVALALVLMTVVAALAARRAEAVRPQLAPTLPRAPWEIGVLALAGASLYEILTRGAGPVRNSLGAPQVDVLLLLFPILFVAGSSGLVARAIGRLLPRLRARGTSWAQPFYLASRRLAGASRLVLSLVTVSAIATGILAYAGFMSQSVEATTAAKARVSTGSDVTVTLISDTPVPARFPHPATSVKFADTAVVLGGNVGRLGVDVQGIDPDTFAGAAYWDESFADLPLEELIDGLTQNDGVGVPVIVAGGSIPSPTTVLITGTQSLEVDIRVVHTVAAFPGMRPDAPLVVMDRSHLVGAPGSDLIWVAGDPDRILPALEEADLPFIRATSAEEVLATPDFAALSWIFQFLRGLGVMTGLIAVGVTVLYLEARQRSQEVSYALSRRMGLSRGAHRLSVAVELAVMLGVGLLAGASLSWIAARLVHRQLDPMPALPPSPLFRVPWALLAVTGAAILALSLIGAWRVQRAADRTNVAEVMRLAA